ncbi:alpha/beta hydrolase [Bordetella genomosp. 5]|uniref:Alpha/beta hydrolase n=1 Tax=Bordetella genomosp. 5 TaxID=1395608 RepID=A0A261TQI6_9BORD|nr:alpha/beta hydrolase [Bordetella genomosp. 5]OZI43687.1 alpha/beta hydrolase [Bordetella genomosp. 5]OZI51879.1 alpha/beta hydrolase [Bordetella genomosp. 5]
MSTRLQIAHAGAVFAADTAGEGTPVLFLHANVCDNRMWRAQVEAVGEAFHAIAYDRRGFGQTRAVPEDHSSVSDLFAVLDAVAPDRQAVLVGCSAGGRIAIDAALRHPERVSALVLVSPSVAGAPAPAYPAAALPLLANLQQAEARGDIDKMNAIKARLWLDGPLQPEGRIGGATRSLFLDMNQRVLLAPPTGTDLDMDRAWPRLAEIGVPTLLLWGEYDFPHIQERCRRMVQTLPAVQGHALRGVAHLPSLEQPGEVNALILDFLSSAG